MDDNRILVLDKLNKVKEFIPIFVGVAYLFGFVTINSFLSKYRINSTSFFASEYLVAGTIFTLLFGILFLSIYFSNKHSDKLTDNYSDFLLPALVRILLLSYTFCFLIIDSSIVAPKVVITYNYIALFIALSFSFISLTKLSNLLRWIIYFILTIIGNIFVFWVCKECRFLQVMVLTFGIYAVLTISDVFEKKYQVAQMLGNILMLITLAMLFGYGVYDNIAKRFGGGKPESITLLIDVQKLNCIPENIKIIDVNKLNAQLIHSSDKEYSFKQDKIYFTLNKDLFFGYINNK